MRHRRFFFFYFDLYRRGCFFHHTLTYDWYWSFFPRLPPIPSQKSKYETQNNTQSQEKPFFILPNFFLQRKTILWSSHFLRLVFGQPINGYWGPLFELSHLVQQYCIFILTLCLERFQNDRALSRRSISRRSLIQERTRLRGSIRKWKIIGGRGLLNSRSGIKSRSPSLTGLKFNKGLIGNNFWLFLTGHIIGHGMNCPNYFRWKLGTRGKSRFFTEPSSHRFFCFGKRERKNNTGKVLTFPVYHFGESDQKFNIAE